MDRVQVTYQPNSDPQPVYGQPGRFSKDTVSEALLAAYELTPARPWNCVTEIRLDGEPVYDRGAATNAVRRISMLVEESGLQPLEAAKQVAEADGHS